MKIAPSLLSADFMNLQKDVSMLNANADIAHLDIMDGEFVPNLSFGFSVVDALKGKFTIPVDAHLMVKNPERWFGRFASDGIDMLSFHWEESRGNTSAFIDTLHSLGLKAGVAINPDIPVSRLYPYIGKADYLLIMSVFAGFGGQKFIYESLDRVAGLRKKIQEYGADTQIEVDGGVGPSNVKALAEAGADILVAGSAVFKSEDPAQTIKLLQSA